MLGASPKQIIQNGAQGGVVLGANQHIGSPHEVPIFTKCTQQESRCANNTKPGSAGCAPLNAGLVLTTGKAFLKLLNVQPEGLPLQKLVLRDRRRRSLKKEVMHFPELSLLSGATGQLGFKQSICLAWGGKVAEKISDFRRLDVLALNLGV